MTAMKTALDDANENKNSADPDVLEAKYNALNNALPLAVAVKTYWTAKTAAKAALDNSDYNNVTGTERSVLSNAVNATVANTIDEYNAQATTIDNAKTTFTNAKANYDALVTAISAAQAIVTASVNVGNAAFQIPTAALATLSSAITTANGVKDNAETTSESAAAAAATLSTAATTYEGTTLNVPDESTPYSLYLSDGEEYAKTVTFKDGNAGKGDYTIGLTDDAGSYYNQTIYFKHVSGNQYTLYIIDAEGTKHYITTENAAYGGGRNDRIRVTTDAEKTLPVQISASTTEDGIYYLKNTLSSNALIGTSDGGFYTTTKYNKFNINAATKCSVPVAVSSGKYATRIFPFVPSAVAGIKYYSCATVDGANLTLVEVAEGDLAANTPYILEASKDVDDTLEGYGLAKTDSYTEGLLMGVYKDLSIAASTETVKNYVLQTQNEKQAFYLVDAAFTASPYRAYLTINTGGIEAPKRLNFVTESSAINDIAIEDVLNGCAIYNVAGQRMQTLRKGINIVNGKKILVK